MYRLSTIVLVVSLVTGAAQADSVSAPVAASPGGADRATVAASCPTFSWGPVRGAVGFELAVYDLEQAASASPVLQTVVQGGATAWTPDVAMCFDSGGSFAWRVRGLTTEGEGEWSLPRFFNVPSVPSREEFARALEIVRRYLVEQESAANALPRSRAPVATPVYGSAAGEDAVSIGAAVAALRGVQSDLAGDTAGVIGTAASPDGAGVIAANQNAGGGADLILDGSAQGTGDTLITESEVMVGGSSFNVANAGGNLDLQLDGVSIVTTATDQDTTYSAGTGLDLTTTTFSANTDYLQRRVASSCPSGQSIRVIDDTGTVTCQLAGTGDITGVTAGTGLTGGGTAGSVTLNADTGYLQRRVSATCAAGSSIRAISSSGVVTCEPDDVGSGDITGVTAGTGLTGGGTAGSVTLNADTTYLQRRVSSGCPSGEAIQSISSTGAVTCVPIPSQ